MSLTTPRKTLLALFASLLVFSTACIRSDLAVSVNDDGSGTLQLIAAVDVKAFGDAMKQFGDVLGGSGSSSTPVSAKDVFDPKDVDMSKLPAGSKVDSYKDGNFEGLKVTMPFSKPEDILPTLAKLNDSLADSGNLSSLGGPSSSAGPRSTPRPGATSTPTRTATPARSGSSGGSNSPADLFEKFTLEKTSGGWRFEAVSKPVSSDVAGDPMTQALMGAILKDASASFTLRMPGKVTQTNADSSKNGELRWNLPIASAQAKTLSATTEGSGTGGGGGGFPILVVVAVIAAVAVIGGLYYMSKQRQASPPAPPSDPPPPVPGTTV